jgi:hypothetical protein
MDLVSCQDYFADLKIIAFCMRAACFAAWSKGCDQARGKAMGSESGIHWGLEWQHHSTR